jgi:hypothetical protein
MSSSTGRIAVAAEARIAPRAFSGGGDHVQAELDWLRLVLHREVLRLQAANLLSSDPFRGLYLADDQVDTILLNWNAEQRRAQPPAIAELTRQAALVRVAIDTRLGAGEAAGRPAPMTRLAAMFHLSRFECHVLIAALAVEMDLRFESLYAWVRNDVTRKSPSVDLVLKLFCNSNPERFRCREALHPDSTLFSRQLLRAGDDAPERDAGFLARGLRIDERIAKFLLGHAVIDRRLAAFTTLCAPCRGYSSLHLPDPLRIQLKRAAAMPGEEILYLCGPRGAGKRSAVMGLCLEAKRPLLVADLRPGVGCLPAAFPLLVREAILQGADLLLEHAEALVPEGTAMDPLGVALERIKPYPGLRIYIAGEAPWPTNGSHHWYRFDFPVPSFAHRVQLWQEALEANSPAAAADIDLESLAGRFALTGGAIHRACAQAARAKQIREHTGQPLSHADLEAAARAQSSHGLRRFAQKIDAIATWESLVVPRHIQRQLRDVCTAERHRETVYGKWGFDRRLTSGKGLNVLFCGTSGTGKTMSAGILAGELGRDLYRIDLSIVVSKYIGETEKQLSLIFREAASSNAVLFFDEADALFGKRSEVKDAHDRYANVEIAYLLQKMEDYEGVVILATNLRRNMDDAFSRRMHHVIEFPFPDAEHRERIWRKILPPGAPLAADVDFGFLARQFEFAGGNIRNVALAAAFYAAENGVPISMEHCIIATALEMQKNGKLPSRAEFRDYYDLIRNRV